MYADGKVLIFVRDIPRFRKLIAQYGLGKEMVYDEIGMENAHQIGKNMHAPVYSSVAFALAMKNGPEEAIETLLKEAESLNPKDLQTALITAFIKIKRQKG